MGDKQPSQEQLNQVYEKVVKTYSQRPNVTGVDIGFKYEGPKRTNQMAVRIHVKEKIPKEALEADELFPQKIDDVPIDIIQANYKARSAPATELDTAGLEPDLLEPLAAAIESDSRRVRFDTLQPGISVGHPNGSFGTLGGVVFDRRTRRKWLCGNWHVFVGSLEAVPGDPIVQPGRKFGGRSPRDRIATLERFLLDAHGDAALALLTVARPATDAQFETGIRVTEARMVQPGEIVIKSGVSTDVTRGIVDGIGQYTINYSIGPRTIKGFKVVPEKHGNPDDLELSSGGDSGAMWYAENDGKGVGLHFAGETDPEPTEENALACHLPDVLEQLNISLVPVGEVVPP